MNSGNATRQLRLLVDNAVNSEFEPLFLLSDLLQKYAARCPCPTCVEKLDELREVIAARLRHLDDQRPFRS